MNPKGESNVKVSIGMPVYNAESSIRIAIDSLISQTFTDFELIISDNASTDSTLTICEEYAKKDNRIRYIRQSENRGPVWNFNFVLNQARSEFFVWAAADDFWEPTFLEKNIGILESSRNVIGSISDVKLFGKITKNLKPVVVDDSGLPSRYQYVYPIYGTYEKKVKTLLSFGWAMNFYSVFRTKELRKSIIQNSFASLDFAVLLNLLKYGELYVIDEFLLNRFTGGITSTESYIQLLAKQNVGIFGIIFPYAKFTLWCLKNVGLRIFMKNFVWFIWLNYRAEKKIFVSYLERLKLKKPKANNLSII